jgi:hypothetical protein
LHTNKACLRGLRHYLAGAIKDDGRVHPAKRSHGTCAGKVRSRFSVMLFSLRKTSHFHVTFNRQAFTKKLMGAFHPSFEEGGMKRNPADFNL